MLDGKAEWDLLQAMPSESGFENDGYGIEFSDFPKWLEQKVEHANGINLPSGFVPQHYYWLIMTDDKGNETPIGVGKLRLPLTEWLLQHAGNIGYGIAPQYRGKGYANVFVAQLLGRAKSKGLDMVLLTVSSNNPASYKAIENNGGRLQKEINNQRWYWIYL